MKRLIGVFTFALLPAFAFGESLLLTANRMLDIDSGRIIEDAAVLIDDGFIVAAGTRAEVGEPPGSLRLDLGDNTLLPGLIDMHVHLTSSPEHHGYKKLALSDERKAIQGVLHAQRTLLAGFTTVRNVGATSFGDVALRDAINSGEIPGLRMFVSGPPVGMTGGHCSDENLLPPEYALRGEGVADGPWAVRAAVRHNIKYGVDMIKTCSTGGVLSKGTKVGAPQYSLEELQALVDEAHSQGLRVASHAHGAQGIRNALQAGVDTVEHASFIDDEGIRLAKKQGAWLGMDIYVTEFILGEGESKGILPESLEKERMTGQTQRDNFRKAHQAGVKMIYSTDAGVYPHGHNARQLSRMVQFGMTPLEALRTATVNSAEALGQGDRLGKLAAGYRADIIAVGGNPLGGNPLGGNPLGGNPLGGTPLGGTPLGGTPSDDISLLESVRFVMRHGVVYKNSRMSP